MTQHLWRGLQALPALAALALLRWLPLISQPPELDAQRAAVQGVLLLPWRLDALTLTLLLALTVGVALVPLAPRDSLRALAALALLLPGLLFEHLLMLPLVLLGVALLLWDWRWLLAATLLLTGMTLLYRTGGAGWYSPASATALSSPLFLLLLAAAYIGLHGYPLGLLGRASDSGRAILSLALQPIWLLPLLRTIGWGPWNSGWALAALLLGGTAALGAATSALWTTPDRRVARIVGAWLGLALASIGLLTPVGIASTLWQILASALGLGLLLSQSRWRLWAAPLPLSSAFLASWLVQGATAASGTFLLTGVCWLVAIMTGLATLRLRDETLPPPAPGSFGGLATGLSLTLGVLAPLPLRWLIVPAIDLLQGGLTPFGLLDIWPWIGLAALDSGQRRVAVLPSIAVALLALVVAALVWLVSRLLSTGAPATPDEPAPIAAADQDLLSELLGVDTPGPSDDRTHSQTTAADEDWWAQLQRRVWWAGGARRRG